MTLYVGNIVRHKDTGQLYECTRCEEDGLVSVRDLRTRITLTGGTGMFESDHSVLDFEKIAQSRHDLNE